MHNPLRQRGGFFIACASNCKQRNNICSAIQVLQQRTSLGDVGGLQLCDDDLLPNANLGAKSWQALCDFFDVHVGI